MVCDDCGKLTTLQTLEKDGNRISKWMILSKQSLNDYIFHPKYLNTFSLFWIIWFQSKNMLSNWKSRNKICPKFKVVDKRIVFRSRLQIIAFITERSTVQIAGFYAISIHLNWMKTKLKLITIVLSDNIYIRMLSLCPFTNPILLYL